MLLDVAMVAILIVVVVLIAASLFAMWGSKWGSIPDERAAEMVGDAYFSGEAPAYVAMTRAIDLEASPERVWPWLAQTGRGAGWYSWDLLDNGGRKSARHLVSWIPEPAVGDATAIGYLRDVAPGERLSWWAPGLRYPGTMVSLGVDMSLRSRGDGARLVVRISAEASGAMARPVIWIFRVIDSIMAIRQLMLLKRYAETFGSRADDPDRPESGDRAQYQLYQTIYAGGEWSGVYGREQAERWRRVAVEAGIDLPQRDEVSSSDTMPR